MRHIRTCVDILFGVSDRTRPREESTSSRVSDWTQSLGEDIGGLHVAGDEL
jgi:hypothetical protein